MPINNCFSITGTSQSQIDLQFTLPEYEVKDLAHSGSSYQKIEIAGAQSLQEIGLPELPILSTTLAIPAKGNVHLEVTSANQRVISGFMPYPLQDASVAESVRGFAHSESFYNGSAVYPQQDIFYSNPMMLREMRVVTINVSPCVYDPATKELRIRESMDIRLSFDDQRSDNELPSEPQALSRAFLKTYESMILNFDDYRNLVQTDTAPRYLIIHGQTTDSSFLNALDAYVLWKKQKGADVDVASTASNQAGSSTSSIQTYIRNRYNNPATRPDYVILIGDTTGSFTIPAFINNSGGSDYPYTFMNSGDILGDVFIGRISVENTNQFLVVLNKIYLYERDIDLATAGWLNHMLLIGDNEPSGISTMYISKYIKEMALEVNPEYTFTEGYGPEFPNFVTTINAAINQGIGFYSFRGYIDFVPPSESAVFNGYKLPHAITITCATGNYSGSLAETEQMIRYGSTAAPKGSVTAIGMSTSSTHTTFNNVLHGGIFDGVFVRDMRTLGEAMLHGKLYMNEIFGVSSPSNVESFTHWCNLMGDPTMEVYTGIPDSFQIQTIASIPVGLSLLDVAVTNATDVPVQGASVVLSQGSNVLTRGYTDAAGQVILVLPASLNAGGAVLTVSAHNYKPLQHAISIVNTPTLVPDTMVVDDSAGGNSNSLITAGETVNLYFGLRNTGSAPMNQVSGTLYTDSPWVQIIDATVSYPPLLAGSSALPTTPPVVHVAANTPHGAMLRLHLLLSNGSEATYDVSEFVPVESAFVEYVSYSVAGPAAPILDPGETAQLAVNVQNTGTAVMNDVYAQLISENDLIEVTDDGAYLGSIVLNTQVSTITDHFSVLCREQAIPGMVFPMRLRLFNADGFEQIIAFTITVGSITVNNPLGPDSYGYVIYDMSDTTYSEAPQYDWVEISPQLGGLGTSLPIYDAYDSGDEGDQVGAQSLAFVDLPFAFRFYGRLYNRITVCSNGFIALGETGNAEFRNFRLPGAMGPSPMIAAFWDDLATHTGSSISYWFDRANRRFIVEWYNLRNGKNGTSPETFQIMLYDQNYYYTSLGDGPIKIQYHTFNNVDSQSGSRHGNFCTIGIEDHTATRGLEYTFNNTYPIAAAELYSGHAIYITNNPSMYDAPTQTASLQDVRIRQGESLILKDLDSYFSSPAYLSYSLLEHPDVTAESIDGGLKLVISASFFGTTELGVKASDPMGRHIEQYFSLRVDQAYGYQEGFTTSTMPTGWVVGHLGTTTQNWQIVADDRQHYYAKTSVTQGNTANERLSTRSFNLSGYQNTKLRFWMDFQPTSSSSGMLQFSFNNISWTGVDTYNAVYTGYKEYVLPVLDNSSSVRIRWTYTSPLNTNGTANHWIIDDLSLTSYVPDATAPSMVSDFQALGNDGGSVSLSWSPSFDSFFSHYEIYLGEGEVVSLQSPMYSVNHDSALSDMATDHTMISGLSNGLYTVAIRAVDLSGNASELSAPVSFLLGSYPAAVQNLCVSIQDAEVLLTWDEVTTDMVGNPITVSGYRIYADVIPDVEISESNFILLSTDPSVSIPVVGGVRFFRVTATVD